MSVTTRTVASWGGASSITSDLLVSYITAEIRTLEPQLQFARLGVQRDVPKGYDRLNFPQTTQLRNETDQFFGGSAGTYTFASLWGAYTSLAAATGGTAGIYPITEGTNPTAVTWGATSYSSGPSQFGIIVQVTDLLVHNSAIEVVDACTRQVRDAMAREVDDAIQVVVNGGTYGVTYAGGKSTRATLAAGDICTQDLMTKAYRNLAAANAAGLKPFEGRYYVAVIHPFVEADLMSNTSTGSFVDVGRYSSVYDLRAGALGDFRGIRYLRSANVNFYNSTVPVFPTTVLGSESFGWGYFQAPTPILVTTPDSYNALNLYTSIGGKVTLGVTRFEDTASNARIQRVETAASA
jgi:N4-gp56 family major capsid protein